VRLLIEQGPELPGELHYLRDEYSFDFFPADGGVLARRGFSARTSLLIRDLQLEIGLPGQQVLYAWGLHPYTTWSEGALEVPVVEPGVVRIVDPSDLVADSSIEMDDRDAWTSTWDPDRGWVRVSSSTHDSGAAVEIATGVVLRVDAGALRSVWLRPAVIEE
jgi:hypothetical protein